ncbi:MAG TPA: hypothetical protein DCX07_14000 [Phycisphaerales bacterium]|nr:hypothetical protein [Phycisphaerales bacterium]
MLRITCKLSMVAFVVVVMLAGNVNADSIMAWGRNNNQQVTLTNAETLSDFTAIAGGGSSVFALRAGTIVEYAATKFGTVPNPSPATYVGVGAGEDCAYGLTSTGVVKAWGGNTYSQRSGTPTTTGHTAVEGSKYNGLALTSNGSIEVWGTYNTYGMVTNKPTGSGYTQISGGGYWAMALAADGSIDAWGYNGFGQVTNAPTDSGYVKIYAALSTGMALKADGSIAVWGYTGSAGNFITGKPTGTGYTDIAGSESALFALKDGQITAWGANTYGELNVPTLPQGYVYTALAAVNAGTGIALYAIPEPVSLSVLALGGLALLSRRCRRTRG